MCNQNQFSSLSLDPMNPYPLVGTLRLSVGALDPYSNNLDWVVTTSRLDPYLGYSPSPLLTAPSSFRVPCPSVQSCLMSVSPTRPYRLSQNCLNLGISVGTFVDKEDRVRPPNTPVRRTKDRPRTVVSYHWRVRGVCTLSPVRQSV